MNSQEVFLNDFKRFGRKAPAMFSVKNTSRLKVLARVFVTSQEVGVTPSVGRKPPGDIFLSSYEFLHSG
jgi:hypothetical protein